MLFAAVVFESLRSSERVGQQGGHWVFPRMTHPDVNEEVLTPKDKSQGDNRALRKTNYQFKKLKN